MIYEKDFANVGYKKYQHKLMVERSKVMAFSGEKNSNSEAKSQQLEHSCFVFE